MNDDILAVIHPSQPRRYFGVGTMTVLGLLLIYVALASPPAEIGYLVFLLVMGGIALFAASKMWRGTEDQIQLTYQALSLASGDELARVDQIKRVERGMFAFKPSNGFVLHLSEPTTSPRWAPGLLWARGKRIGVGGVTSAPETKAMAQIIEALLVERAQDDQTS